MLPSCQSLDGVSQVLQGTPLTAIIIYPHLPKCYSLEPELLLQVLIQVKDNEQKPALVLLRLLGNLL